MQQLTSNVFVETQSPRLQPWLRDHVRWHRHDRQPAQAQRCAEAARRRSPGADQLRYIINTEPHGDHWTGNAFFDVPVIAHEGVRTRILKTDMAEHVARVAQLWAGGAEAARRLYAQRAGHHV